MCVGLVYIISGLCCSMFLILLCKMDCSRVRCLHDLCSWVLLWMVFVCRVGVSVVYLRTVGVGFLLHFVSYFVWLCIFCYFGVWVYGDLELIVESPFILCRFVVSLRVYVVTGLFAVILVLIFVC